MGIPSVATVPWTVNRLLRELLSVNVSELWREPTGKVLLMRITVTEPWVGKNSRPWKPRPAPGRPGWCASATPSSPPPAPCSRTATN